jgi:transcriptional regulator GlxA family with amidase domain
MRRIPSSPPSGETRAGGSRAAASGRPNEVALVVVPGFSMIAFTAAIEPLRLANYCTGRPLYAWSVVSTDGRPVVASNGVEVAVAGSLANVKRSGLALVCGGLGIESQDHRGLIKELRRLASFGALVGAVCTGTYVLAKGGLLDGYRATIHWENATGLAAEFPDLDISQELFELDRTRLTCAGGTAAIDMMLSLIAREHGIDTANLVADQLIHHRIREASERQRISLQTRHGIAQPRLLAIVERMEGTIETPVSCVELARQAKVSVRQLERLFLRAFGVSPTRYYLGLRLDHARRLLRQTSQPVLSVALACGFVSASHFSKTYHARFGVVPSADRLPPLRTAANAAE